jgi:hypothetical protein
MGWDKNYIQELIDDTEATARPHRENIKKWRDMWDRNFWTEEDRAQASVDNRELITTQLPYNVVNLAARLIDNNPRISCPNSSGNDLGRLYAEKRECWLETLWQRSGKGHPMSPIQAMKMNMLVDGAAACETTWVRHLLSPKQTPFSNPILIRALDPMCVGACYGPLGLEFAYHRYESTLLKLMRRYPGVDTLGYDIKKQSDKCLTVTDFWYADEEGQIWNALLCGDATGESGDFIPQKIEGKRGWKSGPRKSEYPKIPLSIKYNDPTPFNGVEANSILSPMEEAWPQLNVTMSMLMTGMKKHFWPEIYLKSRYDDADDIARGEGAVNILQDPDASFLNPPGGNPDYTTASRVLDLMRGDAEDGTFPRALYGDSGAQRSGYGYAMMTSAGSGRVSETVYQLEQIIEEANELALCFVEKFGGTKGVQLFGYDSAAKEAYGITITKDMIPSYENMARLTITLDGDNIQQLVAMLQMYDRNLVGPETVRDFAPRRLPKDEAQSALMDRIDKDPDIFRARAAKAYFAYYGEALPQGEPDMQPNTADRLLAQQAAQQQAQQQMAPQQQQTLPETGLPPQMQGQLTGQTITGDYQQGADINQLIAQGEIPSPEDFLSQIRGGFSR